jgi:hypothetical protein
MPYRISVCWAGMLGLALFSAPVSPAQALTMKECSAKYQAAKSAGTLGGMKWSDFRKAECGPGASAAAPGVGASGTGAPTAGPPSSDTSAGATTPPTRSGRTAASSRAALSARGCGVPLGDLTEIFPRVGGEGADAHLPRSIQRQ